MRPKVFSLLVTLSLFALSGTSLSAPDPPEMTLTTNGLNVSVNWTTVFGATGYTLLYAPSPYAGPETIGSMDMGSVTSFDITLWDGAAYYVAVQAYDNEGNSDYSNIDDFNLKSNKATSSYIRFKGTGLEPQQLPQEVQWALARTYADFSSRGVLDMFTATLTYNLNLPMEQASPSQFQFWEKQEDGSYLRDDALLTSKAGCLHPRKAILADFNNDNQLDIFVACHGYDKEPWPGEKNKIVLSSQDGIYSINDASDDVGFFHGATSADLNGDGLEDVVVTDNFDPESVYVLLNQGDGTFQREMTSRIPSSLKWKNYFTVDLVDVNEDSYLDLLLGGHEWEYGTDTIVLLNSGNNDFSDVTPIVMPSVSYEGVVLDFTVTGSGDSRTLWILRTSGGDGTFYQSRVIQKLSWPLLNSSIVFFERPAQWIPWIIPTSKDGNDGIASDDNKFGTLVAY